MSGGQRGRPPALAAAEPRTWLDRQDLRATEVGWTWLAASAQGTGINAEAKLLGRADDPADATRGVGLVLVSYQAGG